MIVLAIWLFLLGYSVAITGKRNLGLAYKPQSDGSIKAVDSQGNEARTYSLMDVITCAEPSGQLQGQAAPARPAGAPRSVPPPLQPALRPQLQPSAIPLPGVNLEPLQQLPLPRVPAPNPGGILGGLEDWEKAIAQDVYNGINGLLGGLADALKRVPLPQLPRTPRPLL